MGGGKGGKTARDQNQPPTAHNRIYKPAKASDTTSISIRDILAPGSQFAIKLQSPELGARTVERKAISQRMESGRSGFRLKTNAIQWRPETSRGDGNVRHGFVWCRYRSGHKSSRSTFDVRTWVASASQQLVGRFTPKASWSKPGVLPPAAKRLCITRFAAHAATAPNASIARSRPDSEVQTHTLHWCQTGCRQPPGLSMAKTMGARPTLQ